MRRVNTTHSREHSSELTDGLKWSLTIHAAIALLIILKTVVFPGKPFNYTPTLQVDLVALPDVLKKDMVKGGNAPDPKITKILKEAEESPKPPKEIAQKDEMVVKPEHQDTKKLEERNKRILSRLKSLDKIQEIARETSQDSSKDRSNKLKHSLDLIKGNKLSAGHSLSGDAKEAAEEKYYDILRDHLNENFTLPPWLSRQKYVAQVRIFLDSRGKVHGLKFLRYSGNTQFDDAVKRAIHDSDPFPKPPTELASTFLSDGILFGFPL